MELDRLNLISLSGEVSLTHELKCKEVGFDDILTKPVKRDILIQTIISLCIKK
jgi:CheY-like chemotaxis protein